MIGVDLQHWPLVHGRAAGELQFDMCVAYLAQLDEMLARDERFGMLFVTDRVRGLDVRSMRHFAAWFKENQAVCAERWVGLAMVFDQALPRFLLSTFMTIVRLPMPMAVFEHDGPAARWLADRFAARQLPVPPALVDGTIGDAGGDAGERPSE